MYKSQSILLQAFLCISIISFSNKQVYANNGAIAVAYPTEKQIIIDGDLSDWPSNTRQYSIENFPWGDDTPKAQDYKAYFQVSYNPISQHIFVAVTVVDDEHVFDYSGNKSWDNQDVHLMYIDPIHNQRGSGSKLYIAGQAYREAAYSQESWDPSCWFFGWENVEMAFNRKNDLSIYEWQFYLPGYVEKNRVIGMDHFIVDQDHDSKSTFIVWGPEGGKSFSSERLGDVLLTTEEEPLGKVSGKIKWNDDSIKGFPGRLIVSSKENKNLWTAVDVDSLGLYTAELPYGEYDIYPLWSFMFKDDKTYRFDRTRSKVTTDINQQQVKAPLLTVSNQLKPEPENEVGILVGHDTFDASRVDSFIEVYSEYYEIPGVSLAILKDGEILYHQTYGVKNIFTQAPVTDKTLFEAASITKPVFGFLVNKLAEQNVIDLDKPLYQYLPFEDIEHDERYKKITARYVLSHKTGFPNWGWMNDDGKVDIKFEPGSKYGYSGEGFEYLKRVVSHITEKDISVLLQEEVIEPLGLENIYFMKDPYLQAVVANGHTGNFARKASLPQAPGMAWSMHTEAKSFSKFLFALVNKKGLKPETYSSFFNEETEIVREAKNMTPGVKEYFGLSIHMEKSKHGMAFGHGGNNGDFKCMAKYYEDLGLGYIIFTNSNTGDKLHDDLEKFLITGNQKEVISASN